MSADGKPQNNQMDASANAAIHHAAPDPDAFDEYYRQPGERGDAERLAQLRRRIAPFLLRLLL